MDTQVMTSPAVMRKVEQAADRQAFLEVRAWLEDAWRNGELVDDMDGATAEVRLRPLDRFHLTHEESRVQ